MDQKVCAGRRLCGSDDVASLTKSGPRAIVWRPALEPLIDFLAFLDPKFWLKKTIFG